MNRSLSRSGSRLASRSTPRRSLAASQTITRGIRTLSSRIVKDDRRQESINSLETSTKNISSVAKRTLTNSRALGDGNARRALRSSQAATTQKLVRQVVTTRSSRLTAKSMANKLGTRVNRGSATDPNASPGLSGIQASNDKERERINAITKSALTTINSYITRSKELVTKMQELDSRRRQLIAGVLPKLMDKAPRKQAQIMAEVRQQVSAILGEMGVFKTEYAMIESGVLDQRSLVLRTQGFSAMALNGMSPAIPTNAAVAPGFPAPSSPTTSNRDSAVEFLKKLLIPVPVAVAASTKLGGYSSEGEWRASWNSFVRDFDRYIKLREREESAGLRQAGLELEKQTRLNTLDTANDSHSELLQTLAIYNDTILVESGEIVSSAQAGNLPISQVQLSAMRKIKSQAEDAQDSLDALNLMYKDSYPLSVDDEPEVWVGMLPELLAN